MHDPTTVCPACKAELRLDDLACRSCGKVIRTQPLLGEVLVDERIITREQLETAIKLQHRRLGEILVETGACKVEDLDRALHVQRQGRTRAEMYRKDAIRWRIGFGVALAMALIAGIQACRGYQRSVFLGRLDQEELELSEVAEVMRDPGSPYKFDALRSVAHHLNEASGVGIIDQALRSERWYVKLYAAMLARDSRKTAFVPALIALIEEKHPVVSPVAQSALVTIAGQEVPMSGAEWRAWAKGKGLPVEATGPDTAKGAEGK